MSNTKPPEGEFEDAEHYQGAAASRPAEPSEQAEEVRRFRARIFRQTHHPVPEGPADKLLRSR